MKTPKEQIKKEQKEIELLKKENFELCLLRDKLTEERNEAIEAKNKQLEEIYEILDENSYRIYRDSSVVGNIRKQIKEKIEYKKGDEHL